MSSNDEAKKLAALLDKLCADGSGHINVTADEIACDGGFDITEQTQNSTDCCGGNMACRIPTLHKGIDDKED